MGFLILKHWKQDWNRTYCCSSNLLIYIMKFQDSKYITTTLYLAWAYFSTCWTRRIGLGFCLLFVWAVCWGVCVCLCFVVVFFQDYFLSISLPSESFSAFSCTELELKRPFWSGSKSELEEPLCTDKQNLTSSLA